MSERFTVPDPSAEAMQAYLGAIDSASGVAAAYAVDVPAIIRAEVARYAAQKRGTDSLWPVDMKYLAARFGPEPPPVPKPNLEPRVATTTPFPGAPRVMSAEEWAQFDRMKAVVEALAKWVAKGIT